jgi:hypothetical protein
MNGRTIAKPTYIPLNERDSKVYLNTHKVPAEYANQDAYIAYHIFQYRLFRSKIGWFFCSEPKPEEPLESKPGEPKGEYWIPLDWGVAAYRLIKKLTDISIGVEIIYRPGKIWTVKLIDLEGAEYIGRGLSMVGAVKNAALQCAKTIYQNEYGYIAQGAVEK